MIRSAYRTQNLYEGAFLLARGFNLAGKEQDKNKVTILFEHESEINKESMRFYNGASIEAKKYSDCYRTLKDYIFTK